MKEMNINPNSLSKRSSDLSPIQEQLALEAETLYLEHLRDDPNNKNAIQNYVQQQKELKALINSLDQKNPPSS